jgi:hypothetical protein
MTPSELISQVEGIGCRLQVTSLEPPALRLIDEAKKTTASLRQALSANKREIVALLDSRSKAIPSHQNDCVTPSQATSTPSSVAAKLYMLNAKGIPVSDPTQCYMWTRGLTGFGWHYASNEPPPVWQGWQVN